ncbi:hypothetical protein [Bacillus sp. FJAT-27445]|uniref:hypothetical protein n=1 Tax=Bacillus sp. FJAT-27445 TaxID=1679166 RepID=UPI000743992A|nr:hypothetical protein [Bacillus sp. FJAT-27445]
MEAWVTGWALAAIQAMVWDTAVILATVWDSAVIMVTAWDTAVIQDMVMAAILGTITIIGTEVIHSTIGITESVKRKRGGLHPL